MPKTMFDKIWDAHVIATREDGDCLLWVDRHLVHEGSHHGFAQVKQRVHSERGIELHPEIEIIGED